MRRTDGLFAKQDLREKLNKQTLALYADIDGYQSNALLNSNLDDLCTYFYEKYALEPICLDLENITLDQSETKIDVSRDPLRGYDYMERRGPVYIPGVQVTFFIPFTGDPDLFQCRPSTFSLTYPFGQTVGNELQLKYTSANHNTQEIRGQFDRDIDSVKGYAEYSRRDVESFNQNLKADVRQKVTARRERLLKDKGLVETLGFPLKTRSDAPHTYAVPAIRRRIAPPPVSTTPYTPDPTLEMQEYGAILDICGNMVQVMERSPAAFANMCEEDLRQHFLVQLNGQYEGGATGETFNAQGKTDILIRVNGANIFIAECKFWRGSKTLQETIDQLLGYVTWRDTKTALLIFNKNKNFSATLEEIRQTIQKHQNYKKQIPYDKETGFRYIFRQTNDTNRELMITVLAFDIPA